MDINELETYRLSDAVKFHDQLNPALWGAGETMLPEVREKLLAIADDFREFLGINVEVKDITVSGSNAAYTYTANSDIDLHLVVDLPKADASDIYRELFDAKKYAYNDQNNFRIGGSDVELYVQNANQPHYSQGIYSILDDQWRRVPSRRQPRVDDISVESKYRDLAQRIDAAIESGDLARMNALAAKIRDMRAAGLERTGEFGAENLAFKVLRNNGTLERLRDARRAAKDQVMSLEERRKKKTKKRTKYAYGGVFFPGYGYYGNSSSEAADSGGGDGGGGGESVRESTESVQDVILRFARSSTDFLGMEQQPRIRLRQDPVWSQRNSTFGRYDADAHSIELATAGRHMVDILRTLAHEMTHARQNEVVGLPANAGATGSEYEDSANAMAGRIMRNWAESEPELFQGVDLDEQAVPALTEDPQREQLLKNYAMQQGIRGVELAAFMAQTKHESKNFGSMTEIITDQEAEQNYGGKAILNNYRRGDGARYKGRGFIQLTGRYNYTVAGDALGLPLADRPELAADPQNAARIAVWYWQSRVRPKVRDFYNVRLVTYPINSGLKGLEDRTINFQQYARQYNLPVQPAGRGQQPSTRIAATPPPPSGKPRREPSSDSVTQQQRDAMRKAELARIDRSLGTAFGSTEQDRAQEPLRIDITGTAADEQQREQEKRAQAARNTAKPAAPSAPPQRRTFEDSPSVAEASGYIPTEKEKNDPRFSMALTPDIRPGETGRQANKLGLKTNSQGRPALLMKKLNNLLEAFKLDEKCWDGYRREGMKKKGSRMVPNCVRVSESPRQSLDFDSLYGKVFRITDDSGDPDREGFSIITPLNPGPWRTWKERPQFIDTVRRRLNEPGWLDDYKYDQIISVIRGEEFDPAKHIKKDEALLEVEMNPGAYQRFLRSADAEGIRAGFEAELIFRDTENDPDNRESGEFEPDYDQDQRPFSIDDVINFFTSGDDPMSQRAARQLSDEMGEQFMEWAQEQFDNDYFDQDRFMTWIDDTIWPENDDAFRNLARANLGDDATEQDIEQAAVRLFRDEAEQDWDRNGEWYDRGREELFNDYFANLDQSDWFDAEGMFNMVDVTNQYNIESWPHMRYVEPDDRGGSREWEDIATSMSGATGVPVRVSQSYKSTERGDYYVLEPDGSLTPDEPEDFGLEVVSPPLPLAQAIEQLKRVMSWANSSRGDAYTNRSTGLHMGVSLPVRGGDVDPIKLILFLGDKQLLELFGRASNSYARSAYDRLRDKIKSMRNFEEAGPQQISGLMDLMKNNLIELANRDLAKGVLGAKYVSVHPQQGYIEFRGPGGDYLAKESEIDGVLQNTMLKLAYVMSIAGRDDLHRQEYAKKLYKMLTQDAPESPFMRLFADYSAGTLSGEELKSQWADTVLAAEQPNNDEGVPINPSLQDEYEVFDRSTGTPDDGSSFKVLQTFRANSGQEAVDQAKNTWGRVQGLNFGVRRKDTQAAAEKPKSARAELAKRVTRSTQDVGDQLWRVSLNSQVQYVMARTQAQAVQQAVQNNRVFNKRETRARIATNTEQQQYQLDQRRQQQDSDQDTRDIRATLGAPQAAGTPIPGSTLDIQRQRQQAAQQSQDEFAGRWEIRAQGRLIHTFGGVNSQLDANRFAAGWVGQVRPDLAGTEVEVVPGMR